MIQKFKNQVARSKGYPNWEEMEKWYIDKSYIQDAVSLTRSAMEEVCQLMVGGPELIAKVEKLEKIYRYAGRYEITIQLWGPGNTNVFIEKDGIALTDFGSLDPEDALDRTIEYLDKINKNRFKS